MAQESYNCWFNGSYLKPKIVCVCDFEPNPHLRWQIVTIFLPNIKSTREWTCPGWCGSVGWVLSCKLQVHLFDSQGTCLGGRPGPQLEVYRRQPITLVFLSLSSSLSCSLKINKDLKKKNKKQPHEPEDYLYLFKRIYSNVFMPMTFLCA